MCEEVHLAEMFAVKHNVKLLALVAGDVTVRCGRAAKQRCMLCMALL